MATDSERELVVIVKPDAGLRVGPEPTSARSITGEDVNPLTDLLTSEEIAIRPMFGLNEERLRAITPAVPVSSDNPIPNLPVYYRVEAPDERLDELAEHFRQLDIVQAAYVKPAPELPVEVMERTPLSVEPPSITPDFQFSQQYLETPGIG